MMSLDLSVTKQFYRERKNEWYNNKRKSVLELLKVMSKEESWKGDDNKAAVAEYKHHNAQWRNLGVYKDISIYVISTQSRYIYTGLVYG